MAPRKGLGKGLDSLIPIGSVPVNPPKEKEGKMETGAPVYVSIHKVEPNKNQPRKNFDEEALNELVESIKQHGVIFPIVVQDRGEYYQIIAGERRWRASKIAGLKEVPVIIKNYTEQEIVEVSLIENIQRQDLNPIEEAMAYKQLLEDFNLKQEEVAQRVSKSRTAVTNSMRLLKLHDKIQQMIIDGDLSTGHARALITVDDKEKQLNLAKEIVSRRLSVREVERLMKDLDKPIPEKREKKVNASLENVYKEVAEKLKNKLGTKVGIVSKGESAGKIEIEFYNHEELDRLLELIMEEK